LHEVPASQYDSGNSWQFCAQLIVDPHPFSSDDPHLPGKSRHCFAAHWQRRVDGLQKEFGYCVQAAEQLMVAPLVPHWALRASPHWLG
jgi:hypothetical protein